jgi:L-seryl-tRNA(Ser) seleniumtransferase
MAMSPEVGAPSEDGRRLLPSVDRLLLAEAGRRLLADYPRALVIDALREALQEARASVRDGEPPPAAVSLLEAAGLRLDAALRPSLRPVINATGVILHTNLGRAPLSTAALAAMERVARGYSALEYDLGAGGRGSRHEHLSGLLRRLTGAEESLVVNNNASAVLVALAALASGREVVISRGQLVEIGGGFRIPDVLRQSGARLVEVGTTNRTYLADYAAAVTDATALLLRVHASNFRVVGFVHTAGLEELVGLARERALLVVDDLGSGSLLDTQRYGLEHEPMIQESVEAGADVVCFSGDKLLGGPQAGIILGKATVIARLRSHPLTRALRPDKATLAGLHATLLHYLRGEAERDVPVWRMIATPVEELHRRAQSIVERAAGAGASVAATASAVGGGSLPGSTLPSWAVALHPGEEAPQAVAARLRSGRVPVIARVAEDRVLLDLRTVAPEEDEEVAAAIRGLRTED